MASGFLQLLTQHMTQPSDSLPAAQTAEQSGFVGNQGGPTSVATMPDAQPASQPHQSLIPAQVSQGLMQAGAQLGGNQAMPPPAQQPSPFLQTMIAPRQQQFSTNLNNALTAKFGRGM